LRKRLSALGLLGVAALVLTGCAPAAQETTDTSQPATTATADPVEPVTLTMWSWRTEDVDKYNTIFDVYEAQNPGVTVEFEAFLNTEYNQFLATGLEGSDGPDLAMVRAYGGVQPLIEAGQLIPIDGLVDVSNVEQSLLAAATGRSDGQLYGVPFATQTLQVFYNKAIFDELGLTEPTTWDEFVALNEAIDAGGYTPMALGAKDAWMLPIFHEIVGAARYGGPEFRDALLAGTKDFTDPDYVASIDIVNQMTKYMVDDVVGVAYADSQIQFTSGLAAQFPGGSFELGTFATQAPDMELGVYLVPPPPGAVSSKPLSAGWGDGSFAINAKSPNQEAAIKLLNWLATPEFGQLFVDEVKQFSVIKGLNYSDPLMKEMNELFLSGPTAYINLVDMRFGDPTGSTLIGEGIQSMFLRDMTPAGVADKLQTGISTWFVPGA
jgi:raffinose/stachyose/melibiose transport system substrate-binding protein